MEKRVKILGVRHDESQPDFLKTLEWIEHNVKPGMKVGIEVPKDDEAGRYPFFNQVREAIIASGGVPLNIESPVLHKRYGKILDDHEKLREILRLEEHLAIAPENFAKMNLLLASLETNPVKKKELLRSAKKEAKKIPAARRSYEAYKQLKVDNIFRDVIVSTKRSRAMLKDLLQQQADAAIMGAAHAVHIQEFAPYAKPEVSYSTPEAEASSMDGHKTYLNFFGKRLEKSQKRIFQQPLPTRISLSLHKLFKPRSR